MPLFDKYRAIFIHVPKCAGSSIERTLGIWRSGARPAKSKLLYGVDESGTPLQHLTAAQIEFQIGSDRFSQYFKFAFVRNPFDRAISHWMFFRKAIKFHFGLKDETFGGFLEKVGDSISQKEVLFSHVRPQSDFIFINNLLAADFVGRYETLNEDWTKICGILGVKKRLPHRQKTNHNPWPDYYTQDLARRVYRIYEKDFELFGYDPYRSSVVRGFSNVISPQFY